MGLPERILRGCERFPGGIGFYQLQEAKNGHFRGLQVDVVLVRMPTPGSGRGRKREVGFRAWEVDSKNKRTIIYIKNQDTLCCARAIVTTRAWLHRNDPGVMPMNDWTMLQKGLPRQGVYARQLHQAAGVPEGPCGLAELAKFQQHLSPHYQLKVMSRQKPFFIIYSGPEAPNSITSSLQPLHFGARRLVELLQSSIGIGPIPLGTLVFTARGATVP